MRDREREKTQKALEELIKVEYMAISAYEEALTENEDNKLRRRYERFLRDHERQARDLNNRLVELGGEPVEAGIGSGKVKAGLWGRITGMMGDRASINGMYAGARQGVQIYLKHLDDIHDAKALGVIRRNLENKQDEIQWLEEQMNKAGDEDVKSSAADRKAKIDTELDAQEATVSKGGMFGLPLWLLLAGVAAAVFVFLRRQSEPDFSDDAFQYETSEFEGDTSFGDTSYNGGVDRESSPVSTADM
jgi:rubrerythrin